VGSPVLSTGTVHAQIGFNVTEVTFVDSRIGEEPPPTGYLEICKNLLPSEPGFAGMPFSFTVGAQTITVPAGACSPATQVVGLFSVVVHEIPVNGFVMTGCSTLVPSELLGCDPALQTATVKLTQGNISNETVLTITNGPGDVTSHMTWTTGAVVPNPHLEGAAVAAGSLVYDISGTTTDCTDHSASPSTSAVDIYNPATNTFTSGAPILNPRQDDPVAVLVENGLGIKKIYVIGGTSTCHGTPVAAVDVYDIATNTWTNLHTTIGAQTDLPVGFQNLLIDPGGFMSAAAIGTDIYVFAPSNIGVFHTATDTWSTLTAPPGAPPLSELSEAVTVGNQIEIVTGDGINTPLAQRVLDFNPAGPTLTLEPLVTPAGAATNTIGWAEESTVLLKDKIVSASGDFNSQNQVQIITGNTVLTDNTLIPNNVRDDAEGGSVVGDKMYIVGGQIGGVSGSTNPPVLIGTPNW
jgi:hypothetical protein